MIQIPFGAFANVSVPADVDVTVAVPQADPLNFLTAQQPFQVVVFTAPASEGGGGGVLPAPGTTTLGGVRRNTGSAGQYVTGIDTDGSLLRDTPAGASTGGSGTELQFRSGATTFGGASGTAWTDATRSLTIAGPTLTASAPIMNLSQTFNNAAVAFFGFVLNFTQTAKASGTRLFDLQSSGTSCVRVESDGNVVIDQRHGEFASNPLSVRYAGTQLFSVAFNGIASLLPANSGLQLNPSGGFVDWQGGIQLTSVSSYVAAFRKGTNPCAIRINNTHTNASNGEWLNIGWSSNVCTIVPQANGTGTVRPLIVRHPPVPLATLPTASAAGAGARSVISDSDKAMASNFGSVAAGGGANTVPVISDGTDWRIG